MMRPAFNSTRQAAFFALLLLFFLAAPWLSVKKLLPRQEQTYTPESIRWGKFWWLERPLLEETNDIDIAFVGSSRMYFGIDESYVQARLEERLRRKSVVRSVCCFGNGFDRLYLLTRDLLAHRRVKTLVFYDECSGLNPDPIRHLAPFCLVDGDVAVPALPLSNQAAAYYSAMTRLTSDLRGSMGARLPKAFDPQLPAYAPQTGVTPADMRVFTAATATNFVFSNQPLPAGQIYYARQFERLAGQHGCQLVALHLPLPSAKTQSVITESRNWSELTSANVCLMGIPEGRLFAGLSEPQMKLLFNDPLHFSENGRKYFTHLITPAVLQFYESHSTD